MKGLAAAGHKIKERLVIRLDHKAPEQPSPEVCSWSKYNPPEEL